MEPPSQPSASRSPDESDLVRLCRELNAHEVLYDRVLLDPKNAVRRQFNAGELPTQVLLDRDGRVRRRFVCERSLGVWESLRADASPIASQDSNPRRKLETR